MSFIMNGFNSLNDSKGFGTVCSVCDKAGGVIALTAAVVSAIKGGVDIYHDCKRAKREIGSLDISAEMLKRTKQVTDLELDNRELDALIRRHIMLEAREQQLMEKQKELEGTE